MPTRPTGAPTPIIAAIGTALPPHLVPQDQITQALASALAPTASQRKVLDRVHGATGVKTRSLALPIDEYSSLQDFSETNRLFETHAFPLAKAAVEDALNQVKLSPEDVDMMFFTTVTGVGAPSLDASLATNLGFRSDLKRTPSFGLGCAAGAAGIARVADYLKGHPEEVAILVSVELCSLTIQWQDSSMANVIGTGLFGDGAACIVMVGQDHPLAGSGILVKATRSSLYKDTQEMIGWKIGTSGLSLMLEAGVPAMIEQNFESDVAALLDSHGIEKSSINVYVAHPGGPKVLTAFEEALKLSKQDLQSSWQVLADSGNMSSAAVLHVLALEQNHPAGTLGLLFALGPGVTSETILLEWQ